MTRSSPKERAGQLGVEMMSVEELFRMADVITVHTPLIKETKHLVNAKTISTMKDGVRIINCARGGIIDEKALYEAIRCGKVAGAALDVFEVRAPVRIPSPHSGPGYRYPPSRRKHGRSPAERGDLGCAAVHRGPERRGGKICRQCPDGPA